MVSKTYAYVGKNFATIDVLIGEKGRVQISFTGGDKDNKRNYQPAKTRPITDPVIQQVIENSVYFRKHIVYLYSKTELAEESSKAEPIVIEEVTDFVSACEYLKKNHNAKATQLRSPQGVKNLAKSLNLEFPNWED